MSIVDNPLQGLRILNTRPQGQNQATSHMIQRMGGQSIELPTIQIEPTPQDWRKMLPDLATLDQAIFISANAVQHFFNVIDPQVWPSNVRVSTIGQSTALALSECNIVVHHIPPIEDSEHLLALKHLQHLHNQTILLIKGEGGRPLIEDTLRAHKANLIPLSVYSRNLPTVDQTRLDFLWRHDAINSILFTSQQAMYNLFTLYGEKVKFWICNKPCFVPSARLAEAALQQGMKTIIIYHHNNLFDALLHYIKGQAHDLKQ